jgi:mannitol operon repressor
MASKRKNSKEAALTKSKDFQGFFDELHSETDRSAAIIVAAFLDEHLKQLLINYFVNDEKETDLLLSSDAALGSFGARIRAAYCLGLLPKEYFQPLKIIKDIRNAFAHQLHGRAFNDRDLAARCERLKSFMPIKPRVPGTPRMLFESAAIFILMDISVRALTVLAKRCKSPNKPSVQDVFV